MEVEVITILVVCVVFSCISSSRIAVLWLVVIAYDVLLAAAAVVLVVAQAVFVAGV